MKLSWVKMYPYFRLLFSLKYWTKRHELRTSLKQCTEHFTNTLTQNGNHPVSDCTFHSWYNLVTITVVVGLHMNVIRPQGCLEVATDLNAVLQAISTESLPKGKILRLRPRSFKIYLLLECTRHINGDARLHFLCRWWGRFRRTSRRQ